MSIPATQPADALPRVSKKLQAILKEQVIRDGNIKHCGPLAIALVYLEEPYAETRIASLRDAGRALLGIADGSLTIGDENELSHCVNAMVGRELVFTAEALRLVGLEMVRTAGEEA